ncbi:hypothetical protein HELRODRAFT_70657, partial [Helobdella robusta]|uniref:AAA+ ATPase domain-containing protein n=1 Tax=Helobdella robusta TaxID=6412 RepID=T1G0A0_HELRO
GSGKTTLITKLVQILKEKGFRPQGFYTEERRVNRERVGFDVVTLDGLKRGSLASVCSVRNTIKNKPMIGKYTVDIDEFENIALPTLQFSSDVKDGSKSLLVVDEIGKMELFSKKFESAVRELFSGKNVVCAVLATIPTAKQRPLAIVEEIRNDKTVKVFQVVTKANRDFIVDEICESIESCLK